jgi:DNA repair protein RecN (Recombination protein N)
LFELEHYVNEALEILEEDSGFFDDAMNELRAKLENAEEKFDALENENIEEVLNRLEDLSELKRKYGGISEALSYKEKKQKELQKYENIEFEKEKLQQTVEKLQKDINNFSSELSKYRKDELKKFSNDLNLYLKQLYLKDIKVDLKKSEITQNGFDIVELNLNSTTLDKISTGEFNRLRLAILALKSEFLEKEGGVLILDEIDANLSGEESMSVAKVLRKLSKKYQIFVISHQPQLTSQGEQHFLVYKDDNDTSKVKELSKEQRVKEIARIISGDKITKEAENFALELLG